MLRIFELIMTASFGSVGFVFLTKMTDFSGDIDTHESVSFRMIPNLW